MDTAVTFIILLGSVWGRPSGQSVLFSILISDGTQLLVNIGEETADCDEDRCHHQKQADGSGPSVQFLSSVRLTEDPGSPRLLVCVLSGLNSPLPDVLWWVDDMRVTLAATEVSRWWAGWGGGYSAIAVWEVSEEEWRSRSSHWCGTVQGGRVYKQKFCSGG